MNKKFLIVGFGNMGSSLYDGLIKIIDKESVYVCETFEEKMSLIEESNKTTDINQFLDIVDYVIFAIKPQFFLNLIPALDINLDQKTIVSIMAGVSIDSLRKHLKGIKIVRSIPNIAASIDEGVIGWIATDEVPNEDKDFLKRVFSNLGTEIELHSENMIDKMTALSASGPAYFYYICEILTNKAIEFGFSEKDALKIARATFIGSAELMGRNNKTAEEWKQKVTSKKGTTQAALEYLDSKNFREIFSEALERAKNRSIELNNN